MSNISELINSGGGKSFKFAQIGDSITGTITAAEVMQKRNFDSGDPEFWSDGKPMQQIRVSLDTDLRDPEDPEDDGNRSVYIKGWGDDLRALRAAIRAAGADDLEEGGKFTATYTRDGELAKGKRGFPPKVKEYTYVKPSGTAGLISDQQSAQQQPEQTPAPAEPQQQAAPTQGNFTPEQLAALKAAGIDPPAGS